MSEADDTGPYPVLLDNWNPVDDILGRPEHAALKEEHEECEKLQAEVLMSLQVCFTASDPREVATASTFIARTIPSLAQRKLAVRNVLTRLLVAELPRPFRVRVSPGEAAEYVPIPFAEETKK